MRACSLQRRFSAVSVALEGWRNTRCAYEIGVPMVHSRHGGRDSRECVLRWSALLVESAQAARRDGNAESGS